VQQWEYQTWVVVAPGRRMTSGVGGVVRSVDGVEHQDVVLLPAALRKAGDEGWELVAVTPEHDTNTCVYSFKRPQQSAAVPSSSRPSGDLRARLAGH
jgi:hypothetical protein